MARLAKLPSCTIQEPAATPFAALSATLLGAAARAGTLCGGNTGAGGVDSTAAACAAPLPSGAGASSGVGCSGPVGAALRECASSARLMV